MFHGPRFISLLYYRCLVYSYTSLNFYALIFKNGKRWYCERKYTKIHEGSLTHLHVRAEQPHARILGQLQNPGMLESKLSNTVCHKLQEQIKMLAMLMYPVQIIVASLLLIVKIKCKCSSHYNFISQDTSKNFKQCQVLWCILGPDRNPAFFPKPMLNVII